MTQLPDRNRVRDRRTALGLTQAELARRAGVSRTAITAIEAARLTPSVSAALAVARALDTSVEDLFSPEKPADAKHVWAGEPGGPDDRCWRAEVGQRIVHYPAGATPMLTPLADSSAAAPLVRPEETLVIACCDPAAGLLAQQYAAVTGLRMLVIHRSSRQSVEMLRAGLVHLAGLHLSTRDKPDENQQVVRQMLGANYRMLRIARWQEGIASAPASRVRSVGAATRARLTWIGRETGSGARQCLDRLLGGRPAPRRIARHHRGVTEAVQSGWADAGVCVQLAAAEAGLDFLPVQEEAYDVCFPAALSGDRRIEAFLSLVRSQACRRMLAELPGYDTAETGSLCDVV